MLLLDVGRVRPLEVGDDAEAQADENEHHGADGYKAADARRV